VFCNLRNILLFFLYVLLVTKFLLLIIFVLFAVLSVEKLWLQESRATVLQLKM